MQKLHTRISFKGYRECYRWDGKPPVKLCAPLPAQKVEHARRRTRNAFTVQLRAVSSDVNPISDYGPTYVPRQKGITDGAWRKADEDLVRAAIKDSSSAAHQSEDGEIILLGQELQELQALAESLDEKAYRGKQLQDAVFRGVRSVADIQQIPKAFRERLVAANVKTGRSKLHATVEAADGTRKFLLQLGDGRVVETVGIPQDDASKPRLTACISSQVGCPMRCTFCATGKGGFARNLTPAEIADQVLTIQEQFGRRVTHIVFMGMGEPLLNVKSVVRAFHIINKQIGIGARNITISTVGVNQGIRRLAEHKLQATLAVSIHAPNQQLRERLVPSARVYPIQQLMADCSDYFRITSRRVTFEYTLMHNVNDSPAQAQELVDLLKAHNLATHVNLIPWNPVDESDFQRPPSKAVKRFKSVLEAGGISATVRVTRGMEAAAACGQLRNQYQKDSLPDFAALS